MADILSDMGYQVYTPNIHITENIPAKNCIVVGQEAKRTGCVSIPFDNYSLHAVSYTHLDVYKRQHMERIFSRNDIITMGLILNCSKAGINNLLNLAQDVYKRQMKDLILKLCWGE